MCCRNDLNYTAASCLTEDRTSKQILESLKMSIENKIPIYVSGYENCLFNAISVNLFGNEKLATQIRVLTCIEMVMNTSLYDMKIPTANFSITVVWHACKDAAIKGAYSSAWSMLVASTVVGCPIQSISTKKWHSWYICWCIKYNISASLIKVQNA